MPPIARGFLFALVVAAACAREEPREASEPGAAPPGVEATVPGDTEAPDAVTATSSGGRDVFLANCATCHGDQGRGDGPAAIGLEPPPSDLGDGQWVTGDGSLAAIRNVIENGSPGTAMIGWKGTLSAAQIDAVARHVQSLSR